MLIDAAHIDGDFEPVRKQLTLDYETTAGLKSGAVEKLSKGVIVYELVMMYPDYDISDDFTALLEDDLDRLDRVLTGNARELLYDIVDNHHHYSLDSMRETQYPSVEGEYPPDKTTVYIPDWVGDELPLKCAHIIEHAARWVSASPWSSRFDMMTDVRDLITLSTGGTVDDPSDFVSDVDQCDTDKYEVADLHDAMYDDADWWHQPSFGMDTLRDRAGDVTQTPRERSIALENALKGEGKSLQYEDVVDLADDVYDPSSRSTAANYADRVDPSVYTQEYIIDCDRIVSEMAANTRKALGDKVANMPAWKLAGLKSDPRRHNGSYDSPDDVVPVLSEMLMIDFKTSKDVFESNREDWEDWCMDRKRDMRQMAD